MLMRGVSYRRQQNPWRSSCGFWSVELVEGLRLVGMKPCEQAVEGDEAGFAGEDAIELCRKRPVVLLAPLVRLIPAMRFFLQKAHCAFPPHLSRSL